MAKITAPLLSFGASGTLGKVITFGSWRGVPYARRHVIPANPQSVAQSLTRDIFANMNTRWKTGGPLMRAPWNRFATGQKFVGRNSYMGKNLQAMRGEADMDDYIGSPGAKGGLPCSSLALTSTAGAGIEAIVTTPTPPTGWTLTSAIGTCFIEQAPEDAVTDAIEEDEDLAATECDFTGLDSVEYQVQVWLKWLKPDGTIAYGASISDQIVVTP